MQIAHGEGMVPAPQGRHGRGRVGASESLPIAAATPLGAGSGLPLPETGPGVARTRARGRPGPLGLPRSATPCPRTRSKRGWTQSTPRERASTSLGVSLRVPPLRGPEAPGVRRQRPSSWPWSPIRRETLPAPAKFPPALGTSSGRRVHRASASLARDPPAVLGGADHCRRPPGLASVVLLCDAPTQRPAGRGAAPGKTGTLVRTQPWSCYPAVALRVGCGRHPQGFVTGAASSRVERGACTAVMVVQAPRLP